MNRGISLNISRTCLRCHVCIPHNRSEGTVSQNYYSSPSFPLMKSRKIYLKNKSNLSAKGGVKLG